MLIVLTVESCFVDLGEGIQEDGGRNAGSCMGDTQLSRLEAGEAAGQRGQGAGQAGQWQEGV